METEIDRKEEMHAEPRSEWGGRRDRSKSTATTTTSSNLQKVKTNRINNDK